MLCINFVEQVWNTATWTRKFALPCFPGCIASIRFLSGDTFVAASSTGLLTTWNLNQKAVLRQFLIPSSIEHVAASRDASVVVVSSGASVSLYRAISNELLFHLVCDFDVFAAEFTPDSRWIMIIGRREVLFRQVSGGCASHKHVLEDGSIMAIAAASGRLALLNFLISPDDKDYIQVYHCGESGYGSIWPIQSDLQTVLTR
jgi:hypothetical protein